MNSNLTEQNWRKRASRFVCFIDVLGFEEKVKTTAHEEAEELLYLFSRLRREMEGMGDLYREYVEEIQLPKTVLFSDTLLIITEGDEPRELDYLAWLCQLLIEDSLEKEHVVPFKGAISKGIFTADFESSVFAGKPLIEAYRLCDEVHFHGIVLHHSAEETRTLEQSKHLNRRPAPLKSGNILHWYIDPEPGLNDNKLNVYRLFDIASGKHRIYAQNSLEFYFNR